MGVVSRLVWTSREYRFELSGLLFVLGVILTAIALFGYVPPLRSWARGTILDNMLVGLGGFIFWEAIVAALVLVVGAFYFADTMKKAREFEKLITTTSKETFLKNRKRLETLAEMYLPERYWRRVEKKRAELKVRD